MKEVAAEGRLAQCQPPIRAFQDETAPMDGGVCYGGRSIAFPA